MSRTRTLIDIGPGGLATRYEKPGFSTGSIDSSFNWYCAFLSCQRTCKYPRIPVELEIPAPSCWNVLALLSVVLPMKMCIPNPAAARAKTAMTPGTASDALRGREEYSSDVGWLPMLV